jgi:glycine/D-amino acid oxidase-like deaminating enzyme/nitrite reductase/ring-hydroxylating ferredoxin subunit
MDTGSGHTASVWMADEELRRYAPLAGDIHADVCVIGAGIAGLSVAYHLSRAGKSVVVIEDGAIGSGETSRTTAHLSNAFDDRYYELEHLHGAEGARLTAESHTQAIDDIERIVAAERIACDFVRLDGYLFVPPGDPLDALEDEIAACHRAGLGHVAWAERAPIEGFETGRCLRFPNQAQFHPLRYLQGLAAAITRRGGKIFTDTHAATVEGGKPSQMGRVTVGENGPAVIASDIVVATNTPVNDLLTLHTKQYPYRTYVIGARVPAKASPQALYWDTADPYHYVRATRAGRDHLLIVGGEDHKTGQQDDGEDRHQALERWARERFPMITDVTYRWSGQVMEPMDALAYIGRNPGDEKVWVVTGDSGNGMTHGAIAGTLLESLIAGRDHPWQRLYDPSRKSLRAARKFASENLNMAAQYSSWVTGGDVKSEDEIPRGSGAVMRRGLEKIAVHRDDHGKLHRCSATCPHLGAIVTWNTDERTWDCPAHGSRFDATGKVLNGPANADLAAAEESKPVTAS